jgi:hypothetical protein
MRNESEMNLRQIGKINTGAGLRNMKIKFPSHIGLPRKNKFYLSE